MRKTYNKILAITMAAALAATSAFSNAPALEAKAKAPKLSKKTITVGVKKTATLTLKNVKSVKKATFKVKNKKVAKLKKKSKFSYKITGVKKGSTKVNVTYTLKNGKKKKLVCKVKVVSASGSTTDQPGSNTGSTSKPGETVKPGTTVKPGETVKPGTTAKPGETTKPAVTQKPTATPTAKPTATPTPKPTATPTPTPTATPTPTPKPTATPTPAPKNIKLSSDTVYGNRSVDGSTISYKNGEVTYTAKAESSGGGLAFYADESKASVPVSDYSKVRVTVTAEGDETPVCLCLTTNGIWGDFVGVGGEYQTITKGGEKTTLEFDLTASDQSKSFIGIMLKYNTHGSETLTDRKFTIHSIELVPSENKVALPLLKEVCSKYFSNVGNCINPNDFNDAEKLNHIKANYNSVTMENSTKPDAILGSWWNKNIVNTSTKTSSYVIPSNYKETKIPELHFNEMDQLLEKCYNNGLKMRAHTLVWHAQTPEWFFKVDYDDNKGYVSKEVMNARLEFYVRTVINHVYTVNNGKYKNTVYTWDVANEYMNNNEDENWSAVYGNRAGENGLGNKPSYLKLAFEVAYDQLKKVGMNGKVSLMYNDFNTYINADKIVEMINYINQGESAKICNGVGMQSHLDINYPSPTFYGETLAKFAKAGFEIQITELDVTINAVNGNFEEKGETDAQQAEYMGRLMKEIIKQKKAGANITGLTIWGLCDNNSWRGGSKPTLFGENINTPKESFYTFVDAFKE